MGKPTYNDIMQAHQRDLKRVYKLDDRQLEMAVRRHMDGANHQERREFYEKVYGEKNKRDA